MLVQKIEVQLLLPDFTGKWDVWKLFILIKTYHNCGAFSCRYPFALSKSSMCTVGAPHTWPQIVAALVWLTDCVKVPQSERLSR